MIIDTQKRTIGIQLRKLVFLLLLVLCIVLLYTTSMLEEPFLGITRSMATLFACALYILGYILSYLKDIHYFYFNNNSSKLIFRYYSLNPLSGEQNSLEMNKADFEKFVMTEKLWGLRKYLIIYQRTNKGIAKYPPVSISILNKTEREKLAGALGKM